MIKMDCPICTAQNEEILLQTPNLRVIAVHNEANAPAFCRVIWQHHVAEMTDLLPAERDELMAMVYKVEAAMRQVLQPEKINLASLGNVVPHLHWHVIARFQDDACFPAPIWAAAMREATFRLPENWSSQVKRMLNAA
ncbi:MAG: HIT family protein [Kingella oralis]